MQQHTIKGSAEMTAGQNLTFVCLQEISRVCVSVCLNVCTSGLATVEVTVRDPVGRDSVDPVRLVPVADLDKTVLCRRQKS